jgi:hypothetical protein
VQLNAFSIFLSHFLVYYIFLVLEQLEILCSRFLCLREIEIVIRIIYHDLSATVVLGTIATTVPLVVIRYQHNLTDGEFIGRVSAILPLAPVYFMSYGLVFVAPAQLNPEEDKLNETKVGRPLPLGLVTKPGLIFRSIVYFVVFLLLSWRLPNGVLFWSFAWVVCSILNSVFKTSKHWISKVCPENAFRK